MAIIAAILLVLDVGLRRLAVDPERLREALARASARRTRRGDATLSAWRRTKRAADRRTKMKDETTPTAEEGRKQPTVAPPPDTASAPGADEPGEEEDGGMISRLKKARDRARGPGPEDGLGDDDP